MALSLFAAFSESGMVACMLAAKENAVSRRLTTNRYIYYGGP